MIQDNDAMQADIHRIVEWCETSSMDLSPKKYKVMHLGKHIYPKDHFIADRKLNTTKCEMGYGFKSLRIGTWHEQIFSAASKANRVLMKSTFICWSDDIARIICPKFVRSHQEFNSNILESFQHRAALNRESYRPPSMTDLRSRREREDAR